MFSHFLNESDIENDSLQSSPVFHIPLASYMEDFFYHATSSLIGSNVEPGHVGPETGGKKELETLRLWQGYMKSMWKREKEHKINLCLVTHTGIRDNFQSSYPSLKSKVCISFSVVIDLIEGALPRCPHPLGILELQQRSPPQCRQSKGPPPYQPCSHSCK